MNVLSLFALIALISMVSALEVRSIESCKDIVHKTCGKEIDALESALKDRKPIAALEAVVDASKCLAAHSDEITEDCLKKSEITLLLLDGVNIDDTSVDGSHDCKDVVDKKCGKKIDALKKAIKDTSVVGIVQGAFDVANCVLQNAQEITKKCLDLQPKLVEMRLDPEFLANHRDGAGEEKADEGVIDDLKACMDKVQATCGDDIDHLTEAIKNGEFGKIIDGIKAVTDCVSNVECSSSEVVDAVFVKYDVPRRPKLPETHLEKFRSYFQAPPAEVREFMNKLAERDQHKPALPFPRASRSGGHHRGHHSRHGDDVETMEVVGSSKNGKFGFHRTAPWHERPTDVRSENDDEDDEEFQDGVCHGMVFGAVAVSVIFLVVRSSCFTLKRKPENAVLVDGGAYTVLAASDFVGADDVASKV